eukprot:221479-Amphidinium_carterae.1
MDGSDITRLFLRHRWTGAKYKVPLQELPAHKSVHDLVIDKNYSEERAAIVNATTGNSQERFQLSRVCTCHHLCQSDEDSDANTPQTKKQMKALAARSSETKRYKRGSSTKAVKEKKEDSVKGLGRV